MSRTIRRPTSRSASVTPWAPTREAAQLDPTSSRAHDAASALGDRAIAAPAIASSDRERVAGGGDVVDAQHVGPARAPSDSGGERAAEPVADLAAGELAEEALARGAERRSGGRASRSSPSRSISSRLCSTVLPKPIPGSSQIRSSRDPAARPPRSTARRGTRGPRRRRRRRSGRPASSAASPSCASGPAPAPALGAERAPSPGRRARSRR